jgi:hypothetical protein
LHYIADMLTAGAAAALQLLGKPTTAAALPLLLLLLLPSLLTVAAVHIWQGDGVLQAYNAAAVVWCCKE